ncbi:hypothetical protein [Rhodovulum strictum]|uniref:Uncharacterized protein n=1 Tax=Rhodovulum strictum TaxID=58314 RepID=A0A844BML2_9RHOB|nr:hypothetical protein [Rhodovulum strictum]MRH22232.1 hypothetical protein [Rhodovulum strictum]
MLRLRSELSASPEVWAVHGVGPHARLAAFDLRHRWHGSRRFCLQGDGGVGEETPGALMKAPIVQGAGMSLAMVQLLIPFQRWTSDGERASGNAQRTALGTFRAVFENSFAMAGQPDSSPTKQREPTLGAFETFAMNATRLSGQLHTG